MTTVDAPEKKAFENIVGKREIAGNQHFYPLKYKLLFSVTFNLLPLNPFSLDKAKFCHLVKS